MYWLRKCAHLVVRYCERLREQPFKPASARRQVKNRKLAELFRCLNDSPPRCHGDAQALQPFRAHLRLALEGGENCLLKYGVGLTRRSNRYYGDMGLWVRKVTRINIPTPFNPSRRPSRSSNSINYTEPVKHQLQPHGINPADWKWIFQQG